MCASSIKSAFRFEGYKVDTVSFEASPMLDFLGYMGNIPTDAWSLGISFRNPLFFEGENAYVGGMDVTLTGSVSNEADPEAENIEIAKMDIGIAGKFSISGEGRFDKKIEDTLVKVQIPALLLPYLRGTITSILANAGFGSVILPLINIHDMAKQSMQDLEVEVR